MWLCTCSVHIWAHHTAAAAAALTVRPAVVWALKLQLIAAALRNCSSMVPAHLHSPTQQHTTRLAVVTANMGHLNLH
jgi:hypothetical protein